MKSIMSKYQIVKKSSVFLLFFLPAFVFGQISGGEIKDEKDKKDKEKGESVRQQKPFERDSLSGTVYHFSGFMQYSYRQFEDQSVYDVHALKNDEIPMYTTGGASIGILMPFTDHLALDAGITFFGHGEAYDFAATESDSTFSYTNVYMQVGVPLKLRYTVGEDLQFFGFAGLTPLNILSRRYDVAYRAADGEPFDLPLTSIKNDFTQFNIMASGGIGVNYYHRFVGVSLSAEYRRHLGNTFSEDNFKRIHKMYGIGLRLGLNVRI
jgi:hypothetical protein